jgi:hypothetical protein
VEVVALAVAETDRMQLVLPVLLVLPILAVAVAVGMVAQQRKMVAMAVRVLSSCPFLRPIPRPSLAA